MLNGKIEVWDADNVTLLGHVHRKLQYLPTWREYMYDHKKCRRQVIFLLLPNKTPCDSVMTT